MKNTFLTCIVFFSINIVVAQSSNDTSLNRRLDVYMQLNHELKFDEMMDYTHPKIFELAPKEKMVELMKSAFNNPVFSMTIDSLSVTNISSPFNFENTEYRKIDYRMLAGLRFNDTSRISDQKNVGQIIQSLQNGFPGAVVKYDEKSRWFYINTTTSMFAIKDPGKPWLFLGLKKDSPEMAKIYPIEVMMHFEL